MSKNRIIFVTNIKIYLNQYGIICNEKRIIGNILQKRGDLIAIFKQITESKKNAFFYTIN